MHEYSIPALAEIPATANIAKAVFRRAAEQPQAVMLRLAGSRGPVRRVDGRDRPPVQG